MMWFRSLAFALALLGAANPAAAEIFNIPCAPGSYLTGFEGHIGDWIDQVKIVCSRWDAERAKFEPSVTIDDQVAGRSGGGNPARSDCPAGSMVTNITAMGFASWKGSRYLQFIQIECREPHEPFVPSGREFFGPDRPLENASILARKMCRTGEAAVGVEGVHDKFIDDIWLTCAARPWPAAASTRIKMPTVPSPAVMRKGGGLIGSGAEASLPPVNTARVRDNTDVYRKTAAGDFVRLGAEDDFLPKESTAPVLEQEPGWWLLDLSNVAFVPGGKGWVAADHLELLP